ncbi:Oligopeptide ABC transporter, periplasmic oligopeptide-binding protein OppA [Clostridiaceae bacterium JG1575]|nr:Oligopeptide ABC transporter, periplasmic oligopeptide-binding protein OppA [Clostridiaceae bacterium JG1575]
MKKRIVSLLLPVVMAASVLAGCGPKTPSTTAAGGGKPPVTKPGDSTPGTQPGGTTGGGTATKDSLPPRPDFNLAGGKVIIGSNTEPTGDFAPPWWQNNATDNAIKGFVEGYGTIEIDRNGMIQENKTVVEKMDSKMNEDGSKTYTFKIKKGLVYSDGVEITAKDFVGSVLLFSSPLITKMNGKATAGNYYKGYAAFNAGVEGTYGPEKKKGTKEFEGVRLIDDMTFSVTIAKEFIPSYYELLQASVGPTPMHFWLKNDAAGKVEIKDEGKGAFFSDNFTLANFKAAIENGKSNPKRPASGPYKIKEWNAASKYMVVELNDKYAGNFEGQKPQIKNVIFRHITSATAIDELKTGGVDILSGMMSGTEIEAGFDLQESNPGKFDVAVYPRAGYGKLAFVCDVYPTKDLEVRQAIAHLLDRGKFTQSFTGGFGTVVNGPYGEGQWMYKEAKAKLNPQLKNYGFDPAKAKELLDKAGWNLDKDGKAYAGSGIRYKKNPETGKLMPLIIQWASTEQNAVSELLVAQLQKSTDVAAAGMEIKQSVMTFQELLNYVYRDGSKGEKYGKPYFNMFNFASNFPVGNVPKDDYTTDPDKVKNGYNTNFILDKQLDDISNNFWKVGTTEKDKFLDGWVKYIVRWNELLPDLPLYSNQIHDFYSSKIKDYTNNANMTLIDTILYAKVEE